MTIVARRLVGRSSVVRGSVPQVLVIGAPRWPSLFAILYPVPGRLINQRRKCLLKRISAAHLHNLTIWPALRWLCMLPVTHPQLIPSIAWRPCSSRAISFIDRYYMSASVKDNQLTLSLITGCVVGDVGRVCSIPSPGDWGSPWVAVGCCRRLRLVSGSG